MQTQPFAHDGYRYRVSRNHAARATIAVLLLLACAVAAVVFVIYRSPPLPSRLKSLLGTPTMTTSVAPTRPASEWVGGRDRLPLRAEQSMTPSEAPLALHRGSLRRAS